MLGYANTRVKGDLICCFFSPPEMQIAVMQVMQDIFVLVTVMRSLKLSTVMRYITALQTNVI